MAAPSAAGAAAGAAGSATGAAAAGAAGSATGAAAAAAGAGSSVAAGAAAWKNEKNVSIFYIKQLKKCCRHLLQMRGFTSTRGLFWRKNKRGFKVFPISYLPQVPQSVRQT